MTVEFPAAEPWPTELFDQFGVRDLERLVVDAQTEIKRRKNAATRNTTAGPRAHLGDGSEAQQKEHIMAPVPGCTCGGRGSCTRCVLNELGDDLPQRMMATALDATAAAMLAPAKPANVVELHSVRVDPFDDGTDGATDLAQAGEHDWRL